MIARAPLIIYSSLCLALSVCSISHANAQGSESLNPMKAVAKATLTGFAERPLFEPTRRPTPVAPPQNTAVQAPILDEPPPTLHLLGVIHGVRDIAMVRDGEFRAKILRTGDHIGNWTLTVVPPVGVRLTRGDRSFDYALFGKSSVAVGAGSAGSIALAPITRRSTAPADAIGMPMEMQADVWQLPDR